MAAAADRAISTSSAHRPQLPRVDALAGAVGDADAALPGA